RCSAGESAGSSAAAIPPWAQRVEPSATATLVTTVTAWPAARACSATESPAMPEPATTTSVVCVQPGSGATRCRASRETITASARSSGAQWQRHVVDQPGGADAGGDEQSGRPRVGRRAEVDTAQGQVVDVDAAQRLGGRLEHGAGAVRPLVRTGPQRPGQRQRLLPLIGAQVAVAAGQREPVRVPYGRAADDPDTQ